MKKIIHPTDFSENALRALDYAIGLSDKFGSELILLNIRDLPTAMNTTSFSFSYTEMEKEERASIIEQLKEYVAHHNETAARTSRIQYQVKFNASTAKGIQEAISENEADLVVVGTKGGSKIRELIVGSTTKSLISEASCPVLAIPEKAVFSGINKMVYASDFNPNDLEVIQRTIDIAQKNDAAVSVLHISKEEPEEDSDAAAFQQWLTEVVEYSNIKFESLVSDKEAEALADYIKAREADLVVFYEKENSFIGGLFHKGMVKQFVDHATTIPLMSFNIHSVPHSGEEQ